MERCVCWNRLIGYPTSEFGGGSSGITAISGGYTPLNCEDVNSGLPGVAWNKNYEGKYLGHHEPALLFYSNEPGSGNSSAYRITLPKDPPKLPCQDGTGGVFEFQLNVAFWFGMVLCDSQSYPNFTHSCQPDTGKNIFDDAEPKSAAGQTIVDYAPRSAAANDLRALDEWLRHEWSRRSAFEHRETVNCL